MPVDNNIIDLPMRLPQSRSPAPDRLAKQTDHSIRLNKKQVSSLIESGAKITEGILSIAGGIVDIARIKAESETEVAGIDARSRALVNVLRAETEHLMESNKGIRNRGEAAALVIRSVMESIPESDSIARQHAIDQLPDLVRQVIANQSPGVFRLNYD
jgi:hypothetical protein